VIYRTLSFPITSSDPSTSCISTQSHTYNDRPTGSHTWPIKWCHFQWPWTTPSPESGGNPLFNIDYIRNGTKQTHSYNWMLITYAPINTVNSNDTAQLFTLFTEMIATAELRVKLTFINFSFWFSELAWISAPKSTMLFSIVVSTVSLHCCQSITSKPNIQAVDEGITGSRLRWSLPT